MTTAYDRVIAALELRGSRRSGKDWQCPGPVHHNGDRRPGLGVTQGDDRVLLLCQAGCATEDVIRALGLEMRDLFDDAPKPTKTMVGTYSYRDENGVELFQVVRYAPKGFKQRRRGANGEWIWSLNGVRRVPYRLPELIAAPLEAPVFVVEGEKDVLAVEKVGGVATCSPGGAAGAAQKPKWRDEYSQHFAGRNVVVVADRDQAGYAHARAAARSIRAIGAVKSVAVAEPAAGNDVSDHLDAGLGLDALVAIALDPEERDDGFISTTELLAVEPQPPRFAIPEMAQRGELTTLFAAIGAGKTSAYQDAVVANAAGREWFSLLAFDEPQVFVVFDWENSQGQVSKSLRRLGLTPENAPGFHYYFSPERANLDTEAGRAEVERIARKHGATCLIFDSRDAAFPNTPEIEGEKVAPAMRAAKDLALRLDLAVLLVSHEPKADYSNATDKLRGHTAWGQLSDQLFRLRRVGDARILEHRKNRGIDLREPVKITLVMEGERDTGPLRFEAELNPSVEAVAQRRSEDMDELEAFLDTHGDTAWGVLKGALGLSDNRLRTAIKSSDRVWQPLGDRKPYSTRPKDGELGLDVGN